MPEQETGEPSANLAPGALAPRTGTYVCGYCGPGGLAERVVIPTRYVTHARARGGRGLSNAELSTPVSRRSTVYEITAGTPLPYCPTCGEATGWDPLTGSVEELLRRRVEARETAFAQLGMTRAEPVDPDEAALSRLILFTDATREVDPQETLVGWMSSGEPGSPCDVCSYPVAARAGYLVATPDVVRSEAYWWFVFGRLARVVDEFGDREQQEKYFSIRVREPERDATPWLICDHCTELFVVDWSAAREHVRRGTRPKGPGRFRNRLRANDYAFAAARAWTRQRGWWPGGAVARSDVVGDCDLCAKPMWADELVAYITAQTAEDWIRRGVLTGAPDRPLREQPHGAPAWTGCLPCAARAAARLHRLGQG